MAFEHNSTVAAGEPAWGSVDKTKLPRAAFADRGDAGKKSTWSYPHHWVKGGGGEDADGVYTTGTMYLHRGGLDAAWSAANGGRSGQQASAEVKAHLDAHRKALGLDKENGKKSHSIPRVLESFYSTPWAITEAKFADILAFIERREHGQLSAEELRAFGDDPLEPDEDKGYSLTSGGVAVIPVNGVISQRLNMLSQFSGGTSTEQLGQTIQKCLKNPDCKALLLDVNSPGGSVGGVAELSDLIYSARGEKPCFAIANTQMCSAAYWIASAADQVIASPSATLGSIGVYMVHSERSKLDNDLGVKRTVISAGKWKAVGNDAEPLGPEGRAKLQDYVNAAYSLFTEAVSRNRKASVEAVQKGFGEGDVAMGRDAVTARLADRVATREQIISELEARARAVPAGVPQTRTTSTFSKLKGSKMDKKLIAALFAKGLIAECDEEAAKAYFAARNEQPPADAAAYVTALLAPKAEEKKAVPGPAFDMDAMVEKLDARIAARQAKEAKYLEDQTRAVCELMGLDATATTEIVALKKPLDDVRTVVRERVAGNSAPLPRVEMRTTEMENFGKGAAEALNFRCLSAAGLKIDEKDQPKNNPFARLRIVEMGEQALKMCGVRTAHMSRNQIAKLALAMDNAELMASHGGQAYYGTSSFPNLTLNSMRKVLAKAYEEAPVTWRKWARQGESVPDFKIFSVVKFGEGSDLEEVPEGHDIPTDTGLKDSREYNAVSKFEKILSFTWEMMANDDLSALSRMPMMQSRAAARTVNKAVYKILTGNPNLADGYALFSATYHGKNLLGTGSTTKAPPSVSTLQAAQAIMRTQTGLNSDAILNCTPRWLIVPAALEATANTLLRSQTDPAISNPAVINAFYGEVEPVVEPLLDATSTVSWYLISEYSEIDTVEVKFLEGEESPFVETWWEPRNDTRFYKVRQTFCALPIAYQGMVQHTGYSG